MARLAPSLAAFAAAACLMVASACGPRVDLAQGLEVADVLTGYHDAGLKEGWNYLKPSISFRLRNLTDQEIGPVQVTVSFWKEGDDGEWDSVIMQGIRAEGLAPHATSDSLLARANIGYRLEGARADFFSHSQFLDVTAKIFGRGAGGHIYALGEFKLDRVIIPQMQ
jgi:hypothetical protein